MKVVLCLLLFDTVTATCKETMWDRVGDLYA